MSQVPALLVFAYEKNCYLQLFAIAILTF